MTFGPAGGATLSAWMAEHARVTWAIDPTPWMREHGLLGILALPLNLDHNRAHPFHPTLSALCRAANSHVDGSCKKRRPHAMGIWWRFAISDAPAACLATVHGSIAGTEYNGARSYHSMD